MKINIGAAAGKAVGFDLETLIVTRLLIQANSGAGKSYLLRKLMEELFGHVQVITIDPEGEFATLREKFGYVLVGKGGETPAHVSTAAELAHRLLELRASAICDLYEMPARERHGWVKSFLEALINAPKKLWHAVIVIVDEAHMFCPEKSAGESEAKEAMIDLTTRGRKRGFCAVWATQRLAKVDKDATSMLLNRLVGGTFEDVDIKRALDLLSVAPEQKHEVTEQLRTLDPGWFYAFGRAISKQRVLFKTGQVQTSHPQPGSSKHAAEPPPPPEKVRELLPKLADLPQVAAEKAQTIAEFKKQIRELKTELAAAKRAPATKGPALDQTVLKESVAHSVRAALEQRDQEWMRSVEQHRQRWERCLSEQMTRLDGALHTVKFDPPRHVAKVSVTFEQIKKNASGTLAVQTPSNPPADNPGAAGGFGAGEAAALAPQDGKTEINDYQRELISAMAQMEALGRRQVPRHVLALTAKKSPSSSTFDTNLRDLRDRNFLNFPSPKYVGFTEAGRAIAPAVDAPSSPQEMLARCKTVAGDYHAKLLDVLYENYPKQISRAELAQRAGVSSSSSTFDVNLRYLRDVGAVEFPGPGTAKLSSWVMLEE